MKNAKNKIFIAVCFIIALFAFAYKANKSSTSITASTSTTITTGSATIATVHFIDVGQADSILIDCGDFEILIDAGNNSDGSIVSEYLSDKVDGNLEIMVATHPDADHIGGLDIVLENYTVETIIDSGKTHTTDTYNDYMTAVRNEENAIFREDDDRIFEIADNAVFTVIEVVDNQTNKNNNSVICRLEIGEISFLFTGDLESEIELEYLHRFEEADVLKVGHHGSGTSSSAEFLNKIKPTYAVISCGENNRYGHPSIETLEKLSANNILTYRTDLQGTIIAQTDGTDIAFNVYPKELTRSRVPTLAPSTTIENTVYVTRTGSKYHVSDCSYITESSIAMTIDEARQKYTPCSRCH